MVARMLIPLAVIGALALRVSADEPSGEIVFKVTDDQGKVLPCRIHFSDTANKPILAPGAPAWRDHFVCAGETTLALRPATYRYAVERGPEWSRAQGTVELKAGEKRTVSVKIKRIADLAAEEIGRAHV